MCTGTIVCGCSALPLGAKCFEVHHAVRRLERIIPGMQQLLLNLLGANTCNNRTLVESCFVMKGSLERNKLLLFCTVLHVLPGWTISLPHPFALSPNLVLSFLFKVKACDFYKELNF